MVKVTEYYTPTCPMCNALKQRLSAIKSDNLEVEFVNALENNPNNYTNMPWVIIEKDGKIILNEHPVSIGRVINLVQVNL